MTELLPSTRGLRLPEVTVEQASVRLQLTATAATACRPCCATPSSAVHGRYQHLLTDLHWGHARCASKLMVRKFARRRRRPSVSTSGPGGGAIGMARSWLIWRRIASWTCCRTARRRPSRPDWPSLPPSQWSVAIAATCTPRAFAGGHPGGAGGRSVPFRPKPPPGAGRLPARLPPGPPGGCSRYGDGAHAPTRRPEDSVAERATAASLAREKTWSFKGEVGPVVGAVLQLHDQLAARRAPGFIGLPDSRYTCPC